MEYTMTYIFIRLIPIVLLIFSFNGFTNASLAGSVTILPHAHSVAKFYKFMLGWDSYMYYNLLNYSVC